MAEIISGSAHGPFGGSPYGDRAEVSGPPTLEVLPDEYREFFATDARSVLVVLYPNHINCILNPSFRESITGWEISGFDSTELDADDSWVGQSLKTNGTGTLRFRDMDADSNSAFIYTGIPASYDYRLDGNFPGRVGSQYAFSAYFKGEGRVRLVMEGYEGTEANIYKSPPNYQGLATVADPAAAPYGDEYLLDSDGQMWKRSDPPFYNDLGVTPVSTTSPLTLVPEEGAASPYLLFGGNAYRFDGAATAVPYYTDMGTPTAVVSDPATDPPGDPLVLDGTDNRLWELKSDQVYYEDTDSYPYIGRVDGQWTEIHGEDWQRLVIQTNAFVSDTRRITFDGAAWVNAWVEVEDGVDLKISSLMLDPNEYGRSSHLDLDLQAATYFDGAMAESQRPTVDDFIWEDEDSPNWSRSWYFYNRTARTRWLYENLRRVAPVGRPIQIYFHDYEHPLILDQESTVEAQIV